MKTTAIILAAGQGKRMQSDVAKQYLLLREKPILYYSIKAFEEAEEIDSIILVVGEGEQAYVMDEIVTHYDFHKIENVIVGGEERYHSVYNGLAVTDSDYVFIHDGARPMVDQAIISRCYQEVKMHKAVVTGMPVKDTIKIADEEGYIKETPSRETVWAVQTPQVFETALVKRAYAALLKSETFVTDDAMVVENFTEIKVKLVKGSYENIKITTPEDLKIMDVFCCKMP